MNKLVKGSIAGAAGIALLLGGAGTFAVWNSSAPVNAGQISTGELKITAQGTPVAHYAGTTDVATVIVPNDTVAITQNVNIVAKGDTLTAALTFDVANGSLLALGHLTMMAFESNGDRVTGLANLSADEATSIDYVVLTGNFPDQTGTTGQHITLNLSDLTLHLTQN